MIKPRTVGMGHVGAHVANSLLLQGLADELYLRDIDFVKSAFETQDLRDSLMFCPYNAKIVDCQDRYEELAGCDVIVNAAGKVSLAAGNRDGELFFTTDTCRTFANRIVDAGFDGIWVSSPIPAIWSAQSSDTLPDTTLPALSVRVPAWIPRACALGFRSPAIWIPGQSTPT